MTFLMLLLIFGLPALALYRIGSRWMYAGLLVVFLFLTFAFLSPSPPGQFNQQQEAALGGFAALCSAAFGSFLAIFFYRPKKEQKD